MKKFISLALAASMALSLVPVTAFAATDNRISNVITVEKNTLLADVTSNVPSVIIEDSNNDIKTALTSTKSSIAFELSLDGAEWDKDSIDAADITIDNVGDIKTKFEFLTKTTALVTLSTDSGSQAPGKITIKLDAAKITGDTAKVTINPKNSTLDADTFTFAKGASGSTVATVSDKVDIREQGTIDPIIIEETVADTFEADKKITLKLNSGFKFVDKGGKVAGDASVVSGTTGVLAASSSNITWVDDRTLEVSIASASSAATILKLEKIQVAEDGADFGDVAEITINGAGVSRTTLEVGTLVDYGTNVSVEDKDLPVIYSGSKVAATVNDSSRKDDNETLEITVEEGTADSWLTNRKTTFTFPEGVKVVGVTVDKDTENLNDDGGSSDSSESDIEKLFNIDEEEVTFTGASKSDTSKKAKLVVKFDLHVAADFKGDITCKVGGAAIGEETEVKVAKAVAPLTVEADKTSVAIDYRNVNVGDITVKEAEAGLWEKDQTITLSVDNMIFESGIKAEVVEGDGEIDDLDIDKKEGTITITVKSESGKTPMAIKLSNVSLYLERSLPAGDYSLSVKTTPSDYATTKGDVLFENYKSPEDKLTFKVSSVEIMKDYVTVATAGRDQGTTFTTEVAVTIDSTTMLVDGKEKTLDVPAYLSAEGWTMLPVRAVTEALATSSNSQPIDWIAGNPGTIMIYYGDKTVAMTLGSTTMYINGTPVPMSTAPVIVNDRAFLPMRDLGRALGLSDDQIKWDATTRTATFNPAATTTK